MQRINLLNTANYNPDNFRIYNVINGQAIEVNDPLMDSPRNFFIDEEVLKAEGVTDFSHYAVNLQHKLMMDLFV